MRFINLFQSSHWLFPGHEHHCGLGRQSRGPRQSSVQARGEHPGPRRAVGPGHAQLPRQRAQPGAAEALAADERDGAARRAGLLTGLPGGGEGLGARGAGD